MVAAVFGMSVATAATPFAVILKPLITEFDSTRGLVSFIPMILFLSAGISVVFVSKALEHHRPQKFLIIGTIAGGASLLLCSLAGELWHLYALALILGGIQTGFSGPVVMINVLSRWFVRKRGNAIGFGLAGVSVGSMMITPIIGAISEYFGWRATYLFCGLLVLAINIPLILTILKRNPEELGLLPDGDEPGSLVITHSPVLPKQKTSLTAYLKSYQLWLIILGFTLTSICNNAINQHQVSFITDMGVSATVAASAFGFTAGITGASGWFAGWLADRLSPRYVAMIFFGIIVGGIIILINAQNMAMVWFFVIVYGIGLGAGGTVLPLITNDIFGAAGFNTVYGFINLFFYAGFAFGPPVAGFIFDATGSYLGVFSITILLFVIAIILTYFIYGAKPRFKPVSIR